jgi:murein DD-endopeptidase MepM/ murein hydrolase activator NlpD
MDSNKAEAHLQKVKSEETMSRSSRFFSSLCFLLTILGFSADASTPARTWRVQWEPARVVNGSPVLFRVTAPAALRQLQGEFLGQALNFRRGAGCRCWYAIAGVSLETRPGQYSLRLGEKGAAGDTAFDQAIPVGRARYPSSTLKVAPGFVEPPKEELARIEEDQAAKKRAFAATEPEPLWSGRFLPPAEAGVSGVFGTARVFNGVKKSQHTGLDFRVSTGTPIHATNNGTVILARPLYFEGNCVMVDHGQGLLTMYLHLSEIKVKEGDKVQAGQLLGLSGGTGRATAPHLHFAVRWRGEYLDPATLLELHPPE